MTRTSYGEKSLHRELAELAADFAPRRFALCWGDEDEDDGGILYWGMRLACGRTVLIDESGRTMARCDSPESAQRMFARRRTVHIIWLDPASPP